MPLFDIERIKRAVSLDEKVYAEIAKDKEGLNQAVVVVLLAATISQILSIVLSGGFGILFLIPALVFILAVWVIGTGIMHILAKLLGGKAQFMDYLKATGFGYAPSALGIIPIIGSLIGGLWSFACYVIATKTVHQLSTGKAIIVVLVPVAILIALIVFVVIAMLATFGMGGAFAGMPFDTGY